MNTIETAIICLTVFATVSVVVGEMKSAVYYLMYCAFDPDADPCLSPRSDFHSRQLDAVTASNAAARRPRVDTGTTTPPTGPAC